jgi:hypothetical protein
LTERAFKDGLAATATEESKPTLTEDLKTVPEPRGCPTHNAKAAVILGSAQPLGQRVQDKGGTLANTNLG